MPTRRSVLGTLAGSGVASLAGCSVLGSDLLLGESHVANLTLGSVAPVDDPGEPTTELASIVSYDDAAIREAAGQAGVDPSSLVSSLDASPWAASRTLVYVHRRWPESRSLTLQYSLHRGRIEDGWYQGREALRGAEPEDTYRGYDRYPGWGAAVGDGAAVDGADLSTSGWNGEGPDPLRHAVDAEEDADALEGWLAEPFDEAAPFDRVLVRLSAGGAVEARRATVVGLRIDGERVETTSVAAYPSADDVPEDRPLDGLEETMESDEGFEVRDDRMAIARTGQPLSDFVA